MERARSRDDTMPQQVEPFQAAHRGCMNHSQSCRLRPDMRSLLMSRQSQRLWAASVVLLGWIAAMAAISAHRAACAGDGQLFSVRAWACVPAGPPIILQRELQRG